MNRESTQRIAGAVLLLLVVLACAVGINFDFPFGGYGFMAAFIFYLVLKPRTADLLKIVALSAALLVANRLLGISGQHSVNVATVCAMLGLATFLMVGLRALRTGKDGHPEHIRVLAPAAAMAIFIVAMAHMPNLALALNPKTLDLYALVFDGSLGFQPGFAAGSLVWHTPWLKTMVAFSYNAVSLAIVGAYAANLKRSATPLWWLIQLFLLAGVVGYLLYFVFPACGPGYAFSLYYPDAAPPLRALANLRMERIPVPEFAARNAVPSLHMAWSVLAWWSLRGLPRWVQTLGLVWVLITIFDTLGSGEHYLVDLVVALPFSLAMLALSSTWLSWSSSRRYTPALTGAAMYAAWLFVIRYGSHLMLRSPVLPWLLIIATAVIVETMRRRLTLPTQQFAPTGPETAIQYGTKAISSGSVYNSQQ